MFWCEDCQDSFPAGHRGPSHGDAGDILQAANQTGSRLTELPTRGWGVIRNVPDHVAMVWWLAGYVKSPHRCPTPGTWQMRLTGEGRRYVALMKDQTH